MTEAKSEQIEEAKPSAEALVVTDPIREPETVFTVMDAHDELAVLEEIQGRLSATMVYSFESGGKKITDLSLAGVYEAIRTLNARGFCAARIASQPPQVDGFERDGERWVRVMVYAEETKTGGGAWGVAEQPEHMRMRGGKTKPDPYYFTKALSKAQRNALKTFIPVQMRETLLAQFLGDETRVRKIKAGPGAGRLAELPPPLTDERATKLRSEIDTAYRELREVNPVAVVPARFHELLTLSAHAHDRLEHMRNYLLDVLEQNKAAA